MFSSQADSYQLIRNTLLSSTDGDVSALENKVKVLTELVIELLREVEALREAQIKQAQSQNIPPINSDYGKAYIDTALLTHNSAGPSGGIEKLLWLFLGSYNEEIPKSHHRFILREVLMLRRLGFTEQEIIEYIKIAEGLEILT